MRRILLLLGTLTSVASCAHRDLAKSSPSTGQSKSAIVETYGSPARSWRSNSKDHWLYETSADAKKVLVFENGVLTSIYSPKDNNETLELEDELKKLKPKTSDNFQDLD